MDHRRLIGLVTIEYSIPDSQIMIIMIDYL